jgi:hypothetical protein
LDDIRHKDTAGYRNIDSQLEVLKKKGALLTDIYHNGSHQRWDKRAKKVLDSQLEQLKKAHPEMDLKDMPSEWLNKAYQNATAQLGKELQEANEKARQRKPTGKDWGGDLCTPGQGNRLSQSIKESGNSIAEARAILAKMLEKKPEILAQAESITTPKIVNRGFEI